MEFIDLEKIKVTNNYLRLDTNVDALIKSIKTVGLISPLVINSKDELIAGGRRYTALKKIGAAIVPINRVEKNELEQELISIDENLVRMGLNGVYFESALKRGQQIYEKLVPTAPRVDLDVEEVELSEEGQELSYPEAAAEKTGLTALAIKKALRREVHASNDVREARRSGELNASQVNELIKLNEEDQLKILPLASKLKLPVKEIRAIVKEAKTTGADEAIKNHSTRPHQPREYEEFVRMAKKMNKVISQIVIEKINYHGPERKMFLKQLDAMSENISSLERVTMGEDDEVENSFEEEVTL